MTSKIHQRLSFQRELSPENVKKEIQYPQISLTEIEDTENIYWKIIISRNSKDQV